VGELPFVGSVYEKRLAIIGIEKIVDLLYHIPHRYLDFSKSLKITQTNIGDVVTLKGELISLKNHYTRIGRKFQIGEVKDASGIISVVWFNQPFLVRNLFPGEYLSLSGKIDWFGRKKALISPEYEKVSTDGKCIHTGGFVPVYPETYGISSKWLRNRIKSAYDLLSGEIKDTFPEILLSKNNLYSLPDAIRAVHFPKSLTEAERGKKRLAFDELLFLQIQNIQRKLSWNKYNIPYKLLSQPKIIKSFVTSLPFVLTPSQQKAITEITDDMLKPCPMNRLLEGDVGSGKTVVATVAAFLCFANGYQTIIMAPTQILAQQHFDTLNMLLQPYKVRISLVTSGSTKYEIGRSDIFIGTHALLYKKVNLEKVALAIIDEQHRFGVEQRANLIKRSDNKLIAPHVLTMTATPIPRTVALTFYGDLDLSTLTESPSGRKKTQTWIVPPQKRDGAYSWIRKNIINNNEQAFVICPLIEESSVESLKSVRAASNEYIFLKKEFKNIKVGLLHGKLNASEKNNVLGKFKKGKINILVATPVVEVGIDVPNATIIIIEAAERYGLAQLHQLRGRVGRGNKKSYCLLFAETKSAKVISRLNAMQESISGFELAELDLKLRGPGEIFGLKQHGFPDLKIATWQDISLIKKSKEVANEIIDSHNKYKYFLNHFNKTQLVSN